MTQRILLVNPRMCGPDAVRMPLSLLALAAVLEPGHDVHLVDGNVDPDAAATVRRLLDGAEDAVVAMTVMPGPQVAPAIAIATAVRARAPRAPIVWGGYFPTLYPDSAINGPYVDFVVRGQGEETLLELVARIGATEPGGPTSSVRDPDVVTDVRGLTWKREGEIVHNADRPFRPPDALPPLPYHLLGDVARYLRPSFMGTRTAVHQAAIGCRYRCSFCGVVSMWNGATHLQGGAGLEAALGTLRDELGANAVQYYDHNFFDREETSREALEVMARFELPWWCYARADTLADFSAGTWELIRKSRLRMAYIGAEAASDATLRRMKKGSRVEHTLAAAARCREYGVIPEFSFVLGGPEDPEGEIDATFGLIKRLKEEHPECEVILYFYSPTPQRDPDWRQRDGEATARVPVLGAYGPGGPELPATPEEWTEPRWLAYVCHQDAPWLTPKIRRRVRDFSRVLSCRFPTVQDYATPAWGKGLLRNLARWRYATGRYGRPWELDLLRRALSLREPQRESI